MRDQDAVGTAEVVFRMADGCGDLVPGKAHPGDAGFDLRARTGETLAPGEFKVVPTGLFLELPPGFECQVRPRSGLAARCGVTVLNSPGTVDAGYRGEVGVVLVNLGPGPFAVRRGDRIAQMVVQRLPEVRLRQAGTLSGSDRGEGGFGSTGRR